jgi:hypothetical protein
VQLAESLPAIRDVQGMFNDMVSNLPELQDLVAALGRAAQVDTRVCTSEIRRRWRV